MTLEVLAWVGFGLAAFPAGLALRNLLAYRTPRETGATPLPSVSILIPARDEGPNIERAVTAALASRGVDVEVVVMDDGSTDDTAEIVRAMAASDPRVRLESAPDLPPGWAGKQHACQALADRASNPVLAFVDADVQLEPDGVARAVRFLEDSGAALCSGFPRQVTRTPVERLVIPLIHFVLLGYLPLSKMRSTRKEEFAAGCGQFMVVRREAYRRAGGHAAIRSSFHDGIKLPRAFRRAGFATDLFDATRLARCRMYHDAREVVMGLAKNAHEGMAGPVGIWVWSALLLGGHVMPAGLSVAGAVVAPGATWFLVALAATAIGIANRLALAIRFRQSVFGALLHPLGVTLLVTIQWYSWARRRAGSALVWKDRVQVEE